VLPPDDRQRRLFARATARRDPRGCRRQQARSRARRRAHPHPYHRPRGAGRRSLPLSLRSRQGERHGHQASGSATMTPQERLDYLRRVITSERCKQLLIELVRVPSPQTALMEAEPLLRKFIETAVEPRLRAMGFADIRYDAMGNLISSYGAARSGKSLMLITNAMNQPQATMRNAYAGDVVDGAQYGLPGEAVLGKGASEQKGTMAAMFTAMDAVIASGVPVARRLVHLSC